MKIDGLKSMGSSFFSVGNIGSGASDLVGSFGEMLKEEAKRLESSQGSVLQGQKDFVNGKLSEDELLMMIEDAKLELSFATTTRNKMLEAYKEIMQMQI